MHLSRNRRGALEGLPLYLIILVVVAAVVIVILLGWLATLNKPALGTTTYSVDGSFQIINSNSATITPIGNQQCNVVVNVPTSGPDKGVALQVSTFDTHSNALSGVQVLLQANSGILNLSASPGLTQNTGGSNAAGVAPFQSVTFEMQPGANTGSISIQFTYSGGVAQGQSTQTIPVDTTGFSC